MEQPNEMNTLSQILNKLRKKGITNELSMKEDGLMHSDSNKAYTVTDLTIIKTYRFEGDSDPSDNAVLYLLIDKENIKSYILDAYGAYSNNDGSAFDDFLKKINVEDRDEQQLFED